MTGIRATPTGVVKRACFVTIAQKASNRGHRGRHTPAGNLGEELSSILSMRTLRNAVIAGIAADITWEIWARAITPIFVGGPLEPAALILSVFGLSSDYRTMAEILHVLTGVLFYPLGYVLVARHVLRFGWLANGVLWGIALWVFALGIMAGIFGGQPFFLGFILLTWMSLIGHVLMAIVFTALFHALDDEAPAHARA